MPDNTIGLKSQFDNKDFSKGVNDYLKALDNVTKATNKAASDVSKSFDGTSSGIHKFGSAFSGINIGGITSGLGSLAGGIVNIGMVAGTAALGGIAALSAGLIGIGVSGVKAAMDVDHQMAQIAATLGETKTAVTPLKDLMSELALDPALTVNATQAGEAIEMLARNGLGLEEILDGAARGTVALANATGSNFSTAADVATDAMAQFGFEASQLSTIGDSITGVLTNSKFTVDDYALALANAGGVAGSLGVDFTDFNTVLAGTASMFSSGSDAGTSFKTLLARLGEPTDEVKAAMEQYGLSIFDATGKMKPMAEIAGQLNQIFNGTVTLTNQVGGATKEQAKAAEKASAAIGDLTRNISQQEQEYQLALDVYNKHLEYYDASEPKMRAEALALQKKADKLTDTKEKLGEYQSAIDAVDGAQVKTISTTKQLTEEEKTRLATILGGTDAMRTILGLAEYSQEEFEALSGEVNKNGLAAESAATRVDSLKGAWEIFMGIIEALQIQIGDAFLPLVRQITENFSQLAAKYGPEVVGVFEKIADVITKVSSAYSKFGVRGVAVSLLGQLGLDTGMVSEAENIIFAINDVIGTLGSGNEENVVSSSGMLASLLGLNPESVIEITGIIDNIVTEFDKIKNIFGEGTENGGGLGGGFSAVIESIKTSIIEALPGLAGDILAGIPTVLQTITDGIAEHFRTNVPAFQESMAEWATSFWAWTQTAINGVGVALAGILLAVTTWVMSPEAQTSLSETGNGIGQSIVAGIGLILEQTDDVAVAMAKIAVGLAAAAVTITGDLLIVGGTIAAGIISGILEKLGIDLQPATFSELQTILTNIGLDAYTIASHYIGQPIVDGIIAALTFQPLVEGFQAFMDGGIDGFKKYLGIASPSSLFFGFGKNIVQGLVNGILNLVKSVTEPFNTMWDDVSEIFNPEKWMILGEDIINGVIEGINENADKVLEILKAMAQDALQGVMDMLGISSPSTEFAEIGLQMMQGLIVGVDGMGDSVKEAIKRELDFTAGMFIDFDLNETERNAAETSIKSVFDRMYEQVAAGTAGVSELMAEFRAELVATGEFNEQEISEAMSAVNFQEIVDTIRSQFGPLTIELKAQAVGLAQSFSAIAVSFADMLKEEMGSLEDARKEMDEFDKNYQKLTETITKQEDKLGDLKKKLTAAMETYGEGSMQVYELREEIKKLNLEMRDNIKAQKEISKAKYNKLFETLTQGHGGTSPVAKITDQISALEEFLQSTEQTLTGKVWDDALGQWVNWSLDRTTAQARLNELLEEQAALEAEITRAQEQQQQLAFLQQQINLMKLIADQGLDPAEILAGITLGLDASMEDLLTATSAVVQAMIDQINADLQIASPSKVMAKIGKHTMAGLIGSIEKSQSSAKSAMMQTGDKLLQGANSMMNNVTNYSTQNFNVAFNGSDNGNAQLSSLMFKNYVRSNI